MEIIDSLKANLAVKDVPDFKAADPRAATVVTVTELSDDDGLQIKDRLNAGESLSRSEKLESPNGKFVLCVQGDGNVCLYERDVRCLWAAHHEGFTGATRLTMQVDGNLRLFNKYGAEKWSTGTGGHNIASSLLMLQDDGNLVINSGGKQLWATNTARDAVPAVAKSTKDKLYVGEILEKNHRLTSPNGKYFLIFQDDDNLVLYRYDVGQVWSAEISPFGTVAERLTLSHDGELRIETPGDSKWTSGTAGKGSSNAYLAIQDNGNAVIVSDGATIWQTNTAQRSRLNAKESLEQGATLFSPNGRFKMTFQSDGNFALYEGKRLKWATNTMISSMPAEVRMLDNDNLVISDRGGVLWSSGTRRRRGGGKAALVLRDNGRAIIRSDGITIWSSDGKGVQTVEQLNLSDVGMDRTDRLMPGKCLMRNQSITSPNGEYSASLRPDGNFVVRRNKTDTIIWTSNTGPDFHIRKLAMGWDSRAVLYNNVSSVKWSAGAKQDDGDASLVIGNDGNLSLDDGSWATNTSFPASIERIQSIKSGESLHVCEELCSAGGDYHFGFNDAANFWIRNSEGRTTYYYNTFEGITGATFLSFSATDGEMEIADANHKSLWRSRSDVKGSNVEPSKLTIQGHGNVCFYKSGVQALEISSQQSGSAHSLVSIGDTLKAGQSLNASQMLVSRDGTYNMRLKQDGNLVLSGRGRDLWSTKTKASSPGQLLLAEDGNLILHDAQIIVNWTSKTDGQSKGQSDVRLLCQDDGNACIYAGRTCLWSRWTARQFYFK